MGKSSGTASTKSVAENADDNGLQRRSEFEEACLGAVEDFRRGQIDKITATTRIVFAISNDCILGFDNKESAYRTYFSMLNHFENELRTAGSEAQADRANTRHVETETHFGGGGPRRDPKNVHHKNKFKSLLGQINTMTPEEKGNREQMSFQGREIQEDS